MFTLSVTKLRRHAWTDEDKIHFMKKMKGQVRVKFEDGTVLECDGMLTAISMWCWSLLEDFPNIPITFEHHVQNYIKGLSGFKKNTLLMVFGKIYDDIFTYATNNNTDGETINHIQNNTWAKMARINNDIYNYTLINLSGNKMTFDIKDILQIMKNEKISKVDDDYPVNEQTAIKPGYVDHIYKEKEKVLYDSEFKENNLVQMLKTGALKKAQLMQCIGPRGTVTDINMHVFRKPIASGYFRGFNKIHDSAIESRTAAMSLINQTDPLRASEYFSRSIVLMAQAFQGIVYKDCGSTNYLDIHIQDESDLELAEGMNYLDPHTGEIKPIRKQDKHLIGKDLKIRYVYGCTHHEHDKVCSTCMGASSRNIPKYRNIGQLAVIALTSMISQFILSTKHLTVSAVSDFLIRNTVNDKYLYTSPDGLIVYLQENAVSGFKEVKIKVHESVFSALSTLLSGSTQAPPSHTASSLNKMYLLLTDKNGRVNEELLDMVPVHTTGYFSKNILNKLQNGEVTFSKDEAGFLEIPLNKDDFVSPLLHIVSKAVSTSEKAADIRAVVRSSVKAIKMDKTKHTPESFMIEFLGYVRSKFNVNLGTIQIIVQTMLARNTATKDYTIPKKGEPSSVAGLDNAVNKRSLGGAMAYERHRDLFQSPDSYLNVNRMNSPMDELLVPEQMNLEYHRLRDGEFKYLFPFKPPKPMKFTS